MKEGHIRIIIIVATAIASIGKAILGTAPKAKK